MSPVVLPKPPYRQNRLKIELISNLEDLPAKATTRSKCSPDQRPISQYISSTDRTTILLESKMTADVNTVNTQATLKLGDLYTEQISDDYFGLNYTYQWERIGDQPWEKFDEISQNLNIKSLRYPGGTAAETLFDIRDPNASVAVDSQGVSYNVTPLDTFLQFTELNQIKPILIVPTAMTLGSESSGGHRDFDPAMEGAVKAFIKDAMAAAPSMGIERFEIGNEYEGYMTSVEYGRVASRIAEIIAETSEEFRLEQGFDDQWVAPDISVQIWSRSSGGSMSIEDLELRNETVLQQFNQSELDAVDSLVSHYYYNEGSNIDEANEQSFSNIAQSIGVSSSLLGIWTEAAGKDLDLIYSEWNVLHSSVDNIGLKQNVVLLEMLSGFLESGVDGLNFWSAQYHGTSLANNDGSLRPTGELFKLASENLVGSYSVEVDLTQGDIEIHAFMGTDGLKLFVTSVSTEIQDVSLDLSSYQGLYDVGFATILGVDESTADGNYRALSNLPSYGEPDVEATLTQIDLANSNLPSDEVLEFVLNPFETLYLELDGTDSFDFLVQEPTFGADLVGTAGDDLLIADFGSSSVSGGQGDDTVSYFGLDSGVYVSLAANLASDDTDTQDLDSIENIIGSEQRDNLIGSVNGSNLYGLSGNDVIRSTGGNNNYIDGGAGDDFIESLNQGSATIEGGSGDDMILSHDAAINANGGPGDDKIFGGSQDDVLIGGSGNDTLKGWGGADEFIFSDNSGSDKILDFEVGLDSLIYQGKTLDQLNDQDVNLTDSVDGVVFSFAGGSDVLLIDLSVSDFIGYDLFG